MRALIATFVDMMLGIIFAFTCTVLIVVVILLVKIAQGLG